MNRLIFLFRRTCTALPLVEPSLLGIPLTSPVSKSSTVTSWESLFPYRPQLANLADGLRMAYVDVGSGPAILFVHGNPTWSFYYHALISGLRHRFRCIAVDHLGCGRSDKPQDYPYSLTQHIANLTHFLDQFDLHELTLVAHDWGGAIGLGALLERPQRFARIVLLNTAAFPPPYFPWRIRVCRMPLLGTLALRGLNLFSRAAITMATSRPGGLRPWDADGLLAPYDSWANRVAVEHFVRDIPTKPTQATWKALQRIEGEIHGLTMPKLLIWGMQDWCFRPECLSRFRAIWPEATAIEIASAGHYVALDAPHEIIAALSGFVR